MSRRHSARRAGRPAGLAALVAVALSACGSTSDGGVRIPTVAAARVFAIAGFTPAARVQPGRPVTIAFTIRRPDGATLTSYRQGTGPHTGIHLIIVRSDLAHIIHEHPPATPSGRFSQTVRFPTPGVYRVLVDAYPNLPGGQPNFQLYRTIDVSGAYRPARLPPFRATETVDGYRFTMRSHPDIHAVQAAFLHVAVTGPQGRKVAFSPWFGALAHAIFFHAGSLDYFHTHVCGAGAPNCTSTLGASRITGSATAPGELDLGVLLPVPGTWRLFLQLRDRGRVLTAPYTLEVKP